MKKIFLLLILTLITCDAYGDDDFYGRLAERNRGGQGINTLPYTEDGYTKTKKDLIDMRLSAEILSRDACELTTFAESALSEKIYGSQEPAKRAMKKYARIAPHVRAQLNQAAMAKYPGSNFDCVDGRGIIKYANIDLIFSDGDLVRRIEQSALTFTFMYEPDMVNVQVTDGKQTISFIVNLLAPMKSYFNDASLNINMASEKTVLREEEGIKIDKNELITTLNSYYASTNSNGSMIEFASIVILNPDVRNTIINILMEGEK